MRLESPELELARRRKSLARLGPQDLLAPLRVGLLLVGDGLADHLDALARLIDIGALGLEQGLAVLFRLAFCPGIGRRQTGLDAFGDELSASAMRASTISSSGTTRTILPLMKR